MALGTTLALAGLATQGVSAGLSFAQASKSKKLQAEAQAAAANSMREARNKLTKNFYKGLGIQKEPYELERNALLTAGTQLTQAGIESERGAAGVAGQVLQAQNQGQRNIASSMGQEMLGLNKVVAQEDSRLRDIGTNLDLETAQGAQLAARNAQMLAAKSMQQGFQSVTGAVDQGLDLFPLYSKTGNNTSAPGTNTSAQSNPQQAYNTMASSGTLNPKYMQDGQPLPYDQALQQFKAETGLTESDFVNHLSQANNTGLGLGKFQPFDDNYGF